MFSSHKSRPQRGLVLELDTHQWTMASQASGHNCLLDDRRQFISCARLDAEEDVEEDVDVASEAGQE